MKRAVWFVAVAALCIAGSAGADDRGGLIGSGTRAEDSGQIIGSGYAAGQTMGSGGATAENGGFLGSGNAVEVPVSAGLSLMVVHSHAGTLYIPIVR